MTRVAPNNGKRITLQHIAQQVGVSRATVSLVLRGSALVADDTRDRVLAAMAELGYVYNRAAASLRTQRSHTVGLIVPDITNPFFAEMTVGIEAQLDKAGYVAMLCQTSETLSKQDRLLATMQEHSTDGLLFCPAEGTPPTALDRLQRSGLPFVFFARHLPGAQADYVGADNVAGAALACDHLIGLGHRRIAYIGGPLQTSAREEREQGYRKALSQNRLPIDESLIVTTPTTREGGYRTIQHLVGTDNPPTAALCFNDVVAIGVMLGLQATGLEPGRDFAVAGFDDIEEAALTRPPLTTVAVSPRQIGEQAVTLLLERIADPARPPRQVILLPRLVIRESCGYSRVKIG